MIKRLLFEGPRKIGFEEIKDSTLGPKQVLVKALYSAISHGTEMNVYRGLAPMYNYKQDFEYKLFLESDDKTWKYPIPYGYTLTGEITKVGSDVTKVKVGDKIFCYEAHGTGAIVSEDAVIKIPEGICPKHAIFNANLNTAYNGMLDARVILGDNVAIFGQGVIGLLALQLAKRAGANKVIVVDMIEKRLEMSAKLGADVIINPVKVKDVALEIKKASDKRGVDVAIEMSGSDRALNEAIRSVAYDGNVVVLGWYPNALSNVRLAGEFHHNRVNLIGSQVGGINPSLSNRWNMHRRQEMVWNFMREFELEGLITKMLPFERVAEAYEIVDKKADEVIQVALSYVD